jgi:hypothetical protein
VPAEGSPAALVSNGSRIGEFARDNAKTAYGELIRVAENGAERRIKLTKMVMAGQLHC